MADDKFPVIAEILHIDVTRDQSKVLVTVRLQNGSAMRIPMTQTAAIRLSALLDRARETHGWQMPNVPILKDDLQ